MIIQLYLHSSMVRLEIQQLADPIALPITFTFQYGQIRNDKTYQMIKKQDENLHSSMVRLEIRMKEENCIGKRIFTFQYGQIRNSCPPRTLC